MTRAGALFTVQGATTAKTARVRDGEIVGIGKAEGVQAGYLLGIGGRSRARRIVTEMPETNAALAIVTRDRKDDVRLSMALNKLTEEDPALRWGQDEMQIGRAHVCTPVTNAHLVCRLLLENKNKHKIKDNNNMSYRTQHTTAQK